MHAAEHVVHLVDDDPSFLTAVSRLLRASGHKVLPISSVSAFLLQHGADTAGHVVQGRLNKQTPPTWASTSAR